MRTRNTPVLAPVLAAALAPGLAAGCRPVSIVSTPAVPTVPGEGRMCRNSAGRDQPLVTEWTAAEKANLETQVRHGGVVVSFTGCTMTVLTQCHTREQYGWVRTTPSTDWIEIKNEDELYAKLPLGASSLEGELQGSGSLTMRTTISGQYRLGVVPGAMPAIEGACEDATHVVAGLSIGAYELDAGGARKARLAADVAVVGSAGATSSANKQIIRRSGEATACANATDEWPEASCSSPIQMFLLAVSPPAGSAGPAGPGGQVRTGHRLSLPGGPIDVQLVSADPETSWDVIVDGREVCTTPCSQRIEPSRALLLRENAGLFSRTSRVTLSELNNWAPLGGVQVRAHSTSTWNLPGLARMGGLFYGLIGTGFLIPCVSSSDDRDQFCTVSGMTLGMGVGLFVLGTWIMDSPGRADTSPLSTTF
jgi:hypothetical protein